MTVTAWEPAGITREPSCFRSCLSGCTWLPPPTGRRSGILFVVTLPRTGPDGSSWMYEVTVHPKWRGQPTTTRRNRPPPPNGKLPGRHRWSRPSQRLQHRRCLPGRRSPLRPGKMIRSRQTDSRPRPLGERLASTGAAVIGVVVLGLLLVTLGLVAIVRGQRRGISE